MLHVIWRQLQFREFTYIMCFAELSTHAQSNANTVNTDRHSVTGDGRQACTRCAMTDSPWLYEVCLLTWHHLEANVHHNKTSPHTVLVSTLCTGWAKKNIRSHNASLFPASSTQTNSFCTACKSAIVQAATSSNFSSLYRLHIILWHMQFYSLWTLGL